MKTITISDVKNNNKCVCLPSREGRYHQNLHQPDDNRLGDDQRSSTEIGIEGNLIFLARVVTIIISLMFLSIFQLEYPMQLNIS